MKRVQTKTAVADMFGAGKPGFQDGVPGTTEATDLNAAWCNQVQEELMTVIEAAGLAPGASAQMLTALKTLFLSPAGGKMTGLLELFAGSTAPTAAQFDASTKIATTEFVQRALGNLRNAYWFPNEYTFTVDQIGCLCFPAVAGAKAYLPGIATLPAGASYLIFNHTASAITIQAQTGQSFLTGNGITGNGLAITVQAGSWVKIIRYMATAWLAIGPGNLGLGVGQTWQDLATSRAVGTTYYNTTGRTIFLSVAANSPPGTAGSCALVNGVLVAYSALIVTSGGFAAMLSVPVPPGASYSVTSGNGFNMWAELR